MHPVYDFKRLKRLIAVEHILSVYGLMSGIRYKDHQLIGPCPLHKGDNPTAFRVDTGRQIWHCFTHCGGGDIVALIRKIEGCSYLQAGRILNRIRGANLPQSSTIRHTTPATGFRPFTRRISLNPAAAFLQQHKAISIDTALRFETGMAECSTFLKRAIAVRLHDIHGNPLGYCGRRLEPADIEKWGKWRFPKDFPKSDMLFNAHRAAGCRSRGIIVVECPWAVMRLWQVGFPNAVALLGTMLSSVQRKWIENAPDILLMLDGDTAGRKATAQIASTFKSPNRVSIHHLPDGFDPDDLSDQQLKSVVEQYPFSSL
jgi:DNA primase